MDNNIQGKLDVVSVRLVKDAPLLSNKKICSALDALIINTDRHLGNYGVLINNDTLEIKGMAPVFDHNMALLPYAMEEDFKNIAQYLSERPTRFGEDFNEVAHLMLSEEIISDLKNLRGFEFDISSCPDFPAWRKKELEKVIDNQIDGILHCKRLYIPNINESLFQEQLEGWNEDFLESQEKTSLNFKIEDAKKEQGNENQGEKVFRKEELDR